MLKVELNNHGPDGDPEPCFATRTEIEIADQLRHQLEKRLLAPLTSAPALPATSSDIQAEAPGLDTCHRHEQEQS